jgi:hypothetical protein
MFRLFVCFVIFRLFRVSLHSTLLKARRERVKMRIRSLKKVIGLFSVGLIMAVGVLEGFAQSIPDSADKVHPLLVGAKAPDVNLKKPDGSNFELRKEAAEKPLVLIFYRGGW